MLIDSHCHLDRIDLAPYDYSFAKFMDAANDCQIEHLMTIAIDLEAYPAMLALVADYPQISVTVGVHPNEQDGKDPTADELIELGHFDKVIGIGETGLDYFRSEGDLGWQQQRFRNHINAAKALKKPIIVHTRDAKHDTLRILQEENAAEAVVMPSLVKIVRCDPEPSSNDIPYFQLWKEEWKEINFDNIKKAWLKL